MEQAIVYTAGRARGNPGPAAAGVRIVDAAGEVVAEVTQSIGNSTDDFAQYHSVLFALQTLQQHYGEATSRHAFEIRLDSELVYQQLNHQSPITQPGLIPMFIEIHNMKVANFPQLIFTQVTEEENTEVDVVVNEVLNAV